MAESISDFIRKQAQQQQLNTVGAASIVLDTVEQKPDEVAGALHLADEYASETGGPRPPVEFVQEYGNVLKKEIERKRTGTILSGAPKLADWVRDPVNAALAKDAIKELSWFEGFTRGTANTAERAGERLDIGYNQFMLEQTAGRARDREMSFSDILKEERTSTRFKDEQGNPIETWDGSEYISAFARWVDARYAELIGADDKAAAEEYARALGEAQERLKAIPKSQVATEFENDAMVEGASLGDALVNFGAAFIRNPVGGVAWALETAGESAPQIVAGAVATAVTRNPAAGIAVTGTGSYLTERYTSPAEFFEEKGIDLSKSEDIQRLISDPALMKEAAERGVIRGLVIGAFDALSMGVAGRSLAGNPLVEALAQTAQQMVLGAGGEYTARLAAGQEIDWNEVIAEGFAEGATAVVDMGIAGRKLIRQRSEAREAAETQKKVEELLANAGQNPLRARMPAKFQEFLERATAGTDVENVFVDSQKFVEFFQGLGVDPFEIADTLEGVGAEELRMATLSGGDVKIPVATLATTVPGSGFEEFFIQEARFDPDTMSPSQAAEFNARVDELRAEAFEMAEQLRQEEERARTREQEIYETIVSEMRAAGQSNIVATNAAMVWLANYRTAAADEGVTLDEYLERYPLPKVRGARPEGIIPKNVDELTRTLAEARSRKKTGQVKRGPSLLEFISEYGGIDDAGGELRARNAEIIKRGRGKKTLRLARGGLTAVKDMLGAKAAGKKFGPDDVARAVIEAGYLSDDPVVQEYRAAMEEGREVPDITRALWEGIDRELRGEALYAASSEPDADVVAREEMLDNLEQYLSELGVSLDDPDDVIREAVNRDMEERRTYASGALEQSIRGGFDMSAGGGVKTVKVGDTTLMYSIASDGKSAELFSVRTPASKRGKGSARSAIASFLLETDALGMEVKLSASPLDKKTKLGPLVEFYKSLGFEPTGRAINAAGDPEMVRKPQRSYNQQGRLRTESEAFKRWFGDSKVVDENGKPLVVYHGTASEFEAFSSEADAKHIKLPGFYFTPDPDIADRFAASASRREFRDEDGYIAGYEGAQIVPVYLSLQNPVEINLDDAETGRMTRSDDVLSMLEKAREAGHDGAIIRGWSDGSGDVQYVAFEPTQIKSVFNRGTFDPNDPRIMFQSGDAPNLIVQHNLTAANLLHADRMRGLAVPSVAISNVDYPLDNFGEITLLGGPDMVDPRKDRAAKVFDADIYSPRYPTVHYKLAKPAMKKAWKRLEKVSSELGHVLSGELDDGEVTRNGLSAFRDSMAVQLAFLRETGRDIELPQQAARTNYLDLVPELANMTVDAYGVNNEPEVRNAVERAIDLSIAKTIDAVPSLDADELRSQYYTRDGEIRRSVIDDIQREKHVRRYPGVDRSAARYALREAVQPHAEEFAEWVEDNFGDVIASEVIQTETASGDWKYLPHTLDNVVKVLKKGLRDGEGLNYGVGSIRSTVATQFKSISAIQKARGRLIPSDAMQAVKDEVDDEFVALAGKVGEFSEYSGGFDWLNTFSEQLKEVAARGVGVLDQYFDGLPDELKQEVSDFLNKLANLPSEYFEAKIQRAVDLSEFKAAVIPSDASDAVRNVLRYARVPVFEYDPNVDGSRAEAIRRASTENRLLFQSSRPAENEAFKRWFEGSKVVDEAGNPLVVYHGTGATIDGEFAFDPQKVGSNFGFDRRGFFFTDDERLAQHYVGLSEAEIEEFKSKRPDMAGADIGRAIRLTPEGREILSRHVAPVYLSIKKPLTKEAIIADQRYKKEPTTTAVDFFDTHRDLINTIAEEGGYDGVIIKEGGSTVYVAFEPTQIKSVNNRGTFDPNDARLLYQSDTGARGSIMFPPGGLRSGETIINLFERADMSTFLHESGHYFLENLRDRAALGSEVAQERLAVIRNWWRENARAVAADAKRASGLDVSEADVISWLDNGTTGNGDKDMAIDTGAHEQWARGFEAYLMEGKAPSVELRSAFERFAAWLRWLYKTVAGLNVKINDDIRAVFDRMLATEAEIAKAREVSGGDAALFASAAEMGASEDEFRAYVRLREQADEEAKARLQREIMEPIKREQERWFKEERAKVRSEVEREINAWGQYRAIEWMGNRRWLGEGQPQALPDMRLSKDILVDRYGEGILKTLPRGKQTIYAVEGGLDPDDAAAWFGFESGDEMIRAMETAPKRTDAIEAETDRRMRELHGDPLHDGSVEEEAIAALHNDKRGQWIASELEAVRKTLDGAERLSLNQAREVAKKTIAGMKVRDAMNWRRFLAAERKAAEEAADLGARLSSERYWENRANFAKKDETGAPVRPAGQNDMVARLYMAKRRQLLNHALYAESIRVAEEVAKAERFVAKLQGKKHREKIAGAGRRENAQIDYLAAIDEILQRYDFRKMSARAEDRRGALSAYVEAMRAAGRENELAIPQVVLEPGGELSRATRHEKAMRDAGRIPYKSVPVEELRGVIDALKNIEHTALRWNEFIVNQKKREFNEAAETIARSIIENVGSKPASWIKESGLGAMAKRGVSAYLATVQSATYIMRKLDGRDDFGPVYELLKSDLDAAAYRELTLQRETAEKLRKLFAMYSEDEQRQMAVSKVRPELGGRSFSKWNLIAMALNMGNEGNIARLTNERARFHLKPHEVEAVKSMLDERDARFVQGVWDLISSFRPEIAKRDRRVKGVEPEWVEPTPVTIGGVELRGGYYPIKYDPRHGGGRPSAAAGDDDILQSIMGGGYSSAHTKDGHLKARGTNVNQSLLLDVSVIPRHLNEVIHDLTHSEAVVNTWKLLTDSRVERAFLDAGLDHAYQQLKLWVQDAATGQVGSGSVLAQALTFLRGGFAYSKLAFSVKTILMQPLGVMQSAVAVGKGRMARNMLRMIQHPVAYSNEVLEKSAMMRMRRDTFNKDLMDAAAQANIASPAGNRVKAFWDRYIIPLGMAGMVYTQFYTVDLPTWGAAYEKGMKQFGGDMEKSIQYADMTVQRSQGSGIWTDRTAIERGTLSGSIRQNPFVTLLTTLGSYFFAKANMAFESYDQFRAEGVTLHSSMRFGMDMGLLFLGEAIVVELVKELWDEAFGDDDDDEDDGSFIGNVLTEGVKTAIAGLPVIRDAAGVIQGFDAGTYAAILKVFTSPAYQASQGEVDAAFVKSVINLAGMVGRMPSAQINRIVDASWRQAEGEDVSPMEYIMGRSR